MWNAKEETEKILSFVDCNGPIDVGKAFVQHFQEVMKGIKQR